MEEKTHRGLLRLYCCGPSDETFILYKISHAFYEYGMEYFGVFKTQILQTDDSQNFREFMQFISEKIEEIQSKTQNIICTYDTEKLGILLQRSITELSLKEQVIIKKHYDFNIVSHATIDNIEMDSAFEYMNVNENKYVYNNVKKMLRRTTEKNLFITCFYDSFGLFRLFIVITLGLADKGAFGKFLLHDKLYDPRIFLVIDSMLGLYDKKVFESNLTID